jgi:hypothetical protein
VSRDRRTTAAAVLTLLAVNAWITLWLFRTPYTIHMGSIEGAFIGLARYISSHANDLGWFPLWYGGIPYADSYPPLLHVVVAMVSAAAHISAGLAYHIVVATVYALGPVAFFWTARRLGAHTPIAFAGSLLYSLISPSCWLVGEIRNDTGGWFGARRLVNLVLYGEGPHLLSLLFLTLAIGMLHLAMEKRRPIYYVSTAIVLACTVLSNWIGAFALAVFVTCYLLAGWDGKQGKPWLPRWWRIAAIGCYAYLLAVPWITPSTIATIRTDAPKLVGWKPTLPEGALAAVMAIGILAIAWILRRFWVAPQVRFGAMLFWATAVLTLGSYWLNIKIMPQPERYQLEVDMAFWLTAMFCAQEFAGRLFLVRPNRWQSWAVAAVVLVCTPIAIHQRHQSRHLEQPIEITSTAEYRVSRWLGEHMPGRRVFAPGSVGFWMNAFSDTPMIVGGFDNGITNQFLWAVNYQLYAGDQTEVALAWLKAYGCDAIVGDDPGSGEFYHSLRVPERLHTLPELWRDGAEVIYGVPRARASLAHAIRSSDLIAEAPPAYYGKPLEPFVAALDDPALPEAAFEWRGSSRASISSVLLPEHLLYVQITWDKGWTARVGGEPRKTWADPLGQMVIEPRCSGPCNVELKWDGGTEMRVARILWPSAIAGGMLWILLEPLVRRRRLAQSRLRQEVTAG